MRLGITGTFDVDNYGDCLFPDLAEMLAKQHLPSCKTIPFSPTSRTTQMAAHIKPRCLYRVWSGHDRADVDAFLLCGGDTLAAGHTVSGTYCFLPAGTLSAGCRLWAVPAKCWVRDKIPWGFYSVGVQETLKSVVPGAARVLNTARCKLVRDDFSKQRLAAMGDNALVTPDVGFAISQLHTPAEWRLLFREARVPTGPCEYVVVQASTSYFPHGTDEFVAAVTNLARELDVSLVFLPICKHLADGPFCRRMARQARRMGARAFSPGRDLSTHQTAAVLGCSRGFVGTSLHGCVTALSFGKPGVALARESDRKHAGTLAAAGFMESHVVNESGISIAFHHVSNLPLNVRRLDAIERVRSDFGTALLNLNTAKPAGCLSEEADLESCVRQDIESYDTTPKAVLRRTVFSVLRASPRVFEIYQSGIQQIRRACTRAKTTGMVAKECYARPNKPLRG